MGCDFWKTSTISRYSFEKNTKKRIIFHFWVIQNANYTVTVILTYYVWTFRKTTTLDWLTCVRSVFFKLLYSDQQQKSYKREFIFIVIIIIVSWISQADIFFPGHTLINVECRAWAKNIIYKRSLQNREGSVHFELMID